MMRLILLFILCPMVLLAQPGIVTTIAGGGSSTAEGIPATDASLSIHRGLCVDIHNNIYFKTTNNTIKKVSASTGLISTIAGNGTMGYSGDGGPATAASLNLGGTADGGLCTDVSGNLYVADMENSAVRKITPSDIITTVASFPNYTHDVAVDISNNLYVTVLANHKIYKVASGTGVISTFAGTGVSGSSGDGGPATDATIDAPGNMAISNSGNLYFIGYMVGTVRKINLATGIISTLGGGDGGYPFICTDLADSVYITSMISPGIGKIRGTSGSMPYISYTYIGTGAPFDDNDNGVPISLTKVNADDIYIGIDGSMYYTTGGNKIRKINSYTPAVTGVNNNFISNATRKCSGPFFTISTTFYLPSMKMISYYGDGTIDTNNIAVSGSGGYVKFNHIYPASGSYTIRQILCNGASLLDSATFVYNYDFCRTFSTKLYYESNANCIKDNDEQSALNPGKIIVDSNNISIDTISATSGFSYDARGYGAIYKFRFMASGSNIYVICPASGSIIDTLTSASTYPTKHFGLSCGPSPSYDYYVRATVQAGPHAFRGQILTGNNFCVTPPATLEALVSPKYIPDYTFPIATTVSGNSMSWVQTGLTVFTQPDHIFFKMAKSGGGLDYLPGDTVKSIYTINPITGDANASNNMVVRVDTVKSSFDPNYIEVSPSGCINTNINELTYTIAFENTGNDTAHDIYVLDTLPYGLNKSTLVIEAASAEMDVHIYAAGPYDIVRFDFPNIMLPDSSHHGLCDGMFVYKIKTKQDLAPKIKIENRVGIYFDTNPVVMTNTAYNQVGCPPVSVPTIGDNAPQKAKLFPNPATDELTVLANGQEYNTMTIANMMGEQVRQQNLSGRQTTTNIKDLPSGIYVVTLIGSGNREVLKFVKW